MKNVTSVIEGYASTLDAVWSAVFRLSAQLPEGKRDGMLSDWLQSMWEMLVEVAVSEAGDPVFLEVYGDGADCNPKSSRVYRPDAAPTAAIRCVARSGHTVVDVLSGEIVAFPSVGIVMDRLVRRDARGWYEEAAPFDHVLLSGAVDRVVARDQVEFVLGETI